MKKRTIIGIIIIASSLLAYTTFGSTSGILQKNDNNPIDITKWQKKAPNLFNNVGHNSVTESCLIIRSDLSGSMVELQAGITNPFGIRDDILDFILDNIPKDNNQARLFAIKMAYYDRLALFASESQVNKLVNKGYASLICLNQYLSIQDADKFIKSYEAKCDSDKSTKLLWENVENQLNHHVITADFGIDNNNINKRCEFLLGEIK